MKKHFIFSIVIAAIALSACGKKTADQKINEQITEKVHALTADERILAETNAKQFFNRDFPQRDASGQLATARGMWLDCRPSDSNYNGLVTCHGVLPLVNGGFNDKAVRYCGYTPKMVGCSDEGTVK